MEKQRVVFVRCMFRRGVFPHERIFVIRLGDGWEFKGVAHVAYCLTPEQRPLGDAPLAGSEVDGLVVGIQIAPSKRSVARVQLPDGEIYDLPENQLRVPSRAGDGIHVPVES